MGTHWKIIQITWIAALLATCLAPVKLSATEPFAAVPEKYFLLYSWSDRQNNYFFDLVPGSQEQRFLKRFRPNFSNKYNLEHLASKLARLPSGTIIIWEERQYLGLIMPPAEWADRVIAVATSKRLQIDLNPTLNERSR
jgi:hypothetical protein